METFNSGIMFNTQSPIMTGWWYNPRTGDSFQVRDCYIDNNDYKVQTMDGRLLSYSQLESYVQSDKPITKQPKVNPVVTDNKGLAKDAVAKAGATDTITKEPVKTNINIIDDIPDSILNIIDDGPVITAPSNVIKPAAQTTPKKSVNYEMIDRAIGEKMSKCEIEAKCKWGVVSEDEVKVLVNMMKIDTKEIAEYIYDKRFSKELVLEQIEKNLNYILGKKEE